MISSTGVGSPGNETEYFGSLTRTALMKFQAKYDIVSSGDETTTGYGLVGPGTRAKLVEVFSAAPTAPSAPQGEVPAPPTGVSAVFTTGLSKGSTNSNVKGLQQLLNLDPDTMIASTGVGSPGNETEYFGSLTEKAIQKFQLKHGVVQSAQDPGYGYLGPKTRAKIQELFSGTMETAPSPAPETPPTIQSSSEAQTQEQLETLLKTLQEQVNALQDELEGMQ